MWFLDHRIVADSAPLRLVISSKIDSESGHPGTHPLREERCNRACPA